MRPALIWSFSPAASLRERLDDLGGRARVLVAPRDAGHADERVVELRLVRRVLEGVLDERVLDDLVLDAALRNSARSLVTFSTVIPLKSRKTAEVILSKRALISPIGASLCRRVPWLTPPPSAPTKCSRVDLDAGAHRRADRDAPQVGALGRRRLLPDERADERVRVVGERLLGERDLADAGVDDARLLDAVLDLAALGFADGVADVERDRADLRVRHEAARAEDATELTDGAHHVGRRDDAIEVHEPFVDLRHQVVAAGEVGAGLAGLALLLALGEHQDAHASCPVPCGSTIAPRTI